MISKDTAVQIAYAYRDIETGEELLNKIIKDMRHGEKDVDLRDAFGRKRGLELGIPSGSGSTRLYQLSWDLAQPVIVAHIAKVRARLAELNAIARMEMDGLIPAKEAAE